jgi:PTS system mannose-specific IIC component/fructoselysine and glucoselysine-specific PTS system IIC component
VNAIQILLLSLWAGIAGFQHRALGNIQISRPIFSSAVVGLILGDLQTGLIVGATLELIWIGAQRIGGSVPPNIVIGGILGTATAIVTGQGAEAALAVGIPAALVGSALEVFAKTICSFFIHQADSYAEEANMGGITAMAWLGNLLYFLLAAVPVWIGLSAGADAAQSLFNAIPARLLGALRVVGHLLPAIGFGILLDMLWKQKLAPYFAIGFILSAYLGLDVLAIAVLGVAIAYILLYSGRMQTETS